ncbi:MAG: hypothetical protein L0Y70_10590, partial [Gemmataceae bacterium]|nr:hypothetical protein [Gemmataceae bacterium]
DEEPQEVIGNNKKACPAKGESAGQAKKRKVGGIVPIIRPGARLPIIAVECTPRRRRRLAFS